MADRYLKQIIVTRKDLSMPKEKLSAMVAHASMTFLLKSIDWAFEPFPDDRNRKCPGVITLTPDQKRWCTEYDPGLEDIGQLSMAKIVLVVENEAALLAIEEKAIKAGLTCYRAVDSGHSHNPARTLTAIAIGPHWPEELEPVTGGLKTR